MGEIGIHKNIAVFNSKLTLGLRVRFMSSNLTADKPIPVNPRVITGPPKMSLLLEAQNSPALTIKRRLILVAHSDYLGWYITPNHQQQILILNFDRIVSRSNLTPGQMMYFTTNCFSIDLMLRKTLLLTHMFGTAWAIEITADREE